MEHSSAAGRSSRARTMSMSSARDNLHLDQRSTENEELILKFSSDEAENVTPMHLEFKNVTVVSDDVTLLDNVCGDVKPGEVLAIMGPSGLLLNIRC